MALVFTRRSNEGFWIEVDGIEPIHVILEVERRKNRTRVIVTADQETTKVYRDEVYVRVLQERNNQTSEKGTEPCLERLPLNNPLPRSSKNA